MLLDKEDEDLLDLKWHKHSAGYMVANAHFPERYAHRIVLQRKLKRQLQEGEMCDHINRNKLDNRRANLRLADKSVNSVNREIRPDNTTGFVGVHLYWPKEWQVKGWSKRWSFRIWRKGHKVYTSGLYKTPEEASLARIDKLKEYNY